MLGIRTGDCFKFQWNLAMLMTSRFLERLLRRTRQVKRRRCMHLLVRSMVSLIIRCKPFVLSAILTSQTLRWERIAPLWLRCSLLSASATAAEAEVLMMISVRSSCDSLDGEIAKWAWGWSGTLERRIGSAWVACRESWHVDEIHWQVDSPHLQQWRKSNIPHYPTISQLIW